MNQQLQQNIQKYVREFPRLIGFLVFIGSSAIFYYTTLEPILQASPGVGVVKLNGKYSVVSLILAAVGLALTLVGHRIQPASSAMQSRLKTPLIIAGVAIGVISIVVVEGLKSFLRAKGYVVQ